MTTYKILIITAALTLLACNEAAPPNSIVASGSEDTVSQDTSSIADTTAENIPGVYTMAYAIKQIYYIPDSVLVECQTDKVLFTLNTNDSTLTIKGTETCNGSTIEVDITISQIMTSNLYLDPAVENYLEYWAKDWAYTTTNPEIQNPEDMKIHVFGNYESVMLIYKGMNRNVIHYMNK